MASHTASDMRLAAGVLASTARKLGLDPSELGSPPEPEAAAQPDELELEEWQERDAPPARRAEALPPAAPFDVEAPRPRRPPAPARTETTGADAPFDGERESAVAHAA
jgi:hypothetical protein